MSTSYLDLAGLEYLLNRLSEIYVTKEDYHRTPSIVYAFHIDGSVSDPSNRVTYLEEAADKTPAYMNYSTGKFVYGSWKNAFFMPKPCMLRYDGTVDYYLDEDDYSLKEDGTASDIADTSYQGNAMMEWGQNGKKIWYKVVADENDSTSGTVYISDGKADNSYCAWSFINNQGNEVEHFYTPIYNGSIVNDGTNDVLRSMSGLKISQSVSGTDYINASLANNQSSSVLWNLEVLSDRILINFLLILMGKSTDTQGVFGNGLATGHQTALTNYTTGDFDNAGLFFGYNDNTHGVKVFGMENWWGAQWRRVSGYILRNGVQKIKLTYGLQDGSNTNGYNATGEGYLTVIENAITGTNGGYIDAMNFGQYGMFPTSAAGTATTHYCDGAFYGNGYALFGGASAYSSQCGALACNLNSMITYTGWAYGGAVSCKPNNT